MQLLSNQLQEIKNEREDERRLMFDMWNVLRMERNLSCENCCGKALSKDESNALAQDPNNDETETAHEENYQARIQNFHSTMEACCKIGINGCYSSKANAEEFDNDGTTSFADKNRDGSEAKESEGRPFESVTSENLIDIANCTKTEESLQNSCDDELNILSSKHFLVCEI